MATLSRKIDSSGQPPRNPSPGMAADEKMIRITRLIEGLQLLAQQLPLDGASITERDRVLLADLLNDGVTPCHAAKRVRGARSIALTRSRRLPQSTHCQPVEVIEEML